MEKSRFTEEQVVLSRVRPCPKSVASWASKTPSFTPGEKKYGGISLSKLKQMRQLEEENLRLKKLVADLSLDKAMLQDLLAKKCRSCRAGSDR